MTLKKLKLSSKKIIKRDSTQTHFDVDRIVNAIYKAMQVSQEGSYPAAKKVTEQVINEVKKYLTRHTQFTFHVEDIQDIVEKHLIFSGYAKVAKHYILYRKQHAELRDQKNQISDHIKKLIEDSRHYFRTTLGYVVYLRTYARWLDKEKRRETWIETVDRYMHFMYEKIGSKLSKKQYSKLRQAILEQEVMPSMRLMQFAGPAVRNNNIYAYNCSYIAPVSLEDLAEILYISMCGCGVGFSVENQNIQQLPLIKKQTGKILKTHIVADNKEGWCNAFLCGLKTWFNGHDIEFNFSKLRPVGTRLKTAGGKSSGPEPLKNLLEFVRSKILQNQGKKINTLDAYDIICKIGEVVVSGGVRRSAMISLSDLDDTLMRSAKVGAFYHKEPQRSYANNSAVYLQKPSDEILVEEWLALIKSGTGERGIFNRGSLINTLPIRRKRWLEKHQLIINDKITGFIGTNPCGEIILQSRQFCNLTEISARPHDNEKTLLRKIELATILGTYQATLTQFQYLSPTWKQHCEQEALLGVSITGHWDCKAVRNAETLVKLRKQVIRTNKLYANKFGIKPAMAATCVKPSGTVSLVADCSPGMHPRYAKYYIRRVRISATDALFKMLKDQGIPFHAEVGYSSENSPTFVIDFPVKSPKNAILRNDLTALEHLEYWKLVKKNYTEHNPSVTIPVGKQEWIKVLSWLDENWEDIGGLSFLPRFEDVYRLPPFEEITKQQYEKLIKQFQNINFSKLVIYE